jgi:hypothetical protein
MTPMDSDSLTKADRLAGAIDNCKAPKGTRLSRRIADVLEALDDNGAIERCHHHGCRRLAVGLPDFGPCVESPVCEEHVPDGARLIASLEDTADALRALFAELDRYGIHYDVETGRRK